MATASVLLGLLPATLALLGSTTNEVSLLSLRRPFLAFFIAVGSPSISPIRPFIHDDPREVLRNSREAKRYPQLSTAAAAMLSAVQYVFALAAAANVCHSVAEMGYRAVSTVASELQWIPPMWIVGSLLVYLVGFITLMMRLRLHSVEHRSSSRRGMVWRVITREPILCGRQDNLILSYGPETWLWAALSWLTSTLTVVHIIFGTLIFSGVMFAGPKDAVKIGLRISASTLIARTILMFELYGMRTRVTRVQDSDSADSEPDAHLMVNLHEEPHQTIMQHKYHSFDTQDKNFSSESGGIRHFPRKPVPSTARRHNIEQFNTS